MMQLEDRKEEVLRLIDEKETDRRITSANCESYKVARSRRFISSV